VLQPSDSCTVTASLCVLQSVTACHSELQCVAVCWQCVVVCCSEMARACAMAFLCVLQCFAVFCSVLQRVAVCCSEVVRACAMIELFLYVPWHYPA